MNPEILTVSEEMSVEEAAAFLTEQEITGAPVENSEGDLVGVISVVDIAASSYSGSHSVAELMTRRRPVGAGRGDGLRSSVA